MEREMEREREKFLLSLPFCSIQALDGFGAAHPLWGGGSALLSLQIQILISSRNTLTDTPRKDV